MRNHVALGLLLVAVVHFGVVASNLSSKERKDLEKFYYGTEDDDGDSPEESTTPTLPPKKSTVPEPRSKPSKGSRGKPGKKASDENKELNVPQELVNDARKYIQAGRRTIDRGTERVLPPGLPRIRIIRSSKLSFQHVKPLSSESEDNSSRSRRSSESSSNSEEYDDEEDDEVTTTTTTTTRRPRRTRRTKAPRTSTTRRPSTTTYQSFRSPYDEWSETAMDAGGRTLSILNKLTPPPIPGLPSIPNLDDFGG